MSRANTEARIPETQIQLKAAPPSQQTDQAMRAPFLVAAGVWCLRLPIPSRLQSVNVYLLEDDKGWTLVDTGSHTAESWTMLRKLFGTENDSTSPHWKQKPIQRVLVTHFHPDHIGTAGLLVGRDVCFQTSTPCWTAANRLWNDNPETPHQAHIDFLRRAGISGLELEAFRRNRPATYSDTVAKLPASYEVLEEQQELGIGKRTWTVRLGNGHAAGHVTLWSNDGLAIVGDQILPSISPNLSIHFTEPDADPIQGWLESCHRFSRVAAENTLCLPGHGSAFQGASSRCQQLIDNCRSVIDRLLTKLKRPSSAVDCLAEVYRRTPVGYERMLLIAELMGYLNHLRAQGLLCCRETNSGILVWSRNRKCTSA